MTGPGREERALAQLVRVARQKLEEQQTHLSDLEAAKASAETSLEWLAQAVRAEEAAAASRPQSLIDFRNYLEGANGKRLALEATRDRLAAEIIAVRDQVTEAFAETKKLEHLIEINRRAAARVNGRTEAARVDAAIVSRHRRHA
ncbi:MAG: hypothetical protein VX640_16130 [Pseudomonadota bacterium]|nr:hypothetical protein [Pseudomonadota bacterium]